MAYEPTEWARGTKITAQKLNNIEMGVQSVNSEYTPTTWAEGDIVTAAKLNNIEQGIANASGGGGGENWNTATPHFTIVLNENGTFEYGSDAPETPLVVIENALNNGEIYFVNFSRTLDDELIEFPGIALYARSNNMPYNAMFGCLGEAIEINGRTGQYTETFPE